MDLTLDRPGEHNYIRSFDDRGLRVGDEYLTSSLIITADQLLDWPVTDIEQLSPELLEPILELDPEVVLFGTGKSQVFLPPQMMVSFYRQAIGFEVMNTEAACRTFNVLVSEGRRVAAALVIG